MVRVGRPIWNRAWLVAVTIVQRNGSGARKRRRTQPRGAVLLQQLVAQRHRAGSVAVVAQELHAPQSAHPEAMTNNRSGVRRPTPLVMWMSRMPLRRNVEDSSAGDHGRIAKS